MNVSFPENTELVLVSDVHLRDMKEDRAQKLLATIEAAAKAKAAHLVLLGDIFDFCFGSRKYFHEKFAEVGRSLTKASKTGCRVLFFEGNHEFNLRSLPWQGVEFVPEGSLILQLPSGVRLKLAHGDLIYSSASYRAFRGLVRSGVSRFVASLVPPYALDQYALTHARASRASDVYRKLDHQALMAAANQWLSFDNCDHGIFGHFHVPYDEKREDGRGRILSVDSWAKPNVLYFAEGEFKRVYL